MIGSLLLFVGLSFGASLDELHGCLEANDVPCAREQAEALGGVDASDAEVLSAVARMHFFAGEYPQAYEAIKKAVDAGYTDKYDRLPLYERTQYATANWVEEAHGRFRIRFQPGLDALLLDDAKEVLELSEANIAPRIGAAPPGQTILEIFPTSRPFIASSSLTEDDVRTTGVVALSKWSRLLVMSPKASARGYGWQDTVGHEYIHLVVAHNTGDRAPVWLQEAIAKYLDNRWPDGKDHFRLSVREAGLLQEALAQDDLVTFEEMHPSFAKLPTAERAALAYAQVSTLMAYCFERGGEDVLLRTMPLVRDGMDAAEALAKGTGAADFATLQRDWRIWVAQQNYQGKVLDELPMVLQSDQTDPLETDPLLSKRKDLSRYVTLGNTLRRYDRPKAALVEYAKAIPEDEPPSPVLSNMIAQTHMELGDLGSAQRILLESREDYPEFPLTLKTLGELYAARGNDALAVDSYVEAARFNPFDPAVQNAIIDLAERTGDAALRDKHRRALGILQKGGDDVERKVVHTVEGKYTLPSPGKAAALQERFSGKDAVPFRVELTDGTWRDLADYRGKVVVVDFWATWCGPCRAAMPHLSELADSDPNLVILGLSSESASKIRGFLKKSPVSYDIGFDADGEVSRTYKVSALPTAYVIDAEGKVVDVIVGGGKGGAAAVAAAVAKAHLGQER